MHIFRHLAQEFLDIRQYACGISIQSDEKSDSASSAQSLCGIASKNAENWLLKEGASDTFKVGNASFKLSNGGSEGGNVTGANNKKLQLQSGVYPRMTMDGAKVLFIHFSLTALHSRLLRATDVLQEAAEAATFTCYQFK